MPEDKKFGQSQRALGVALVSAALTSLAYFFFDLRYGSASAAGILYTTIVLFGLLARRKRLVIGLAATSTFLICAGWWLGDGPADSAEFANRSSSLLVLWLVSGVAYHYLTVQAALESALRRFAESDSLTRVLNRSGITTELGKRFAEYQRYGTVFSLLMIDADHFKQINDNHGHLTGDAVLRKIAKVIRNSVRDVDVVGRFGGEEFLVVLPKTDSAAAVLTAERIRTAIAQMPIRAGQQVLHITVSIGVAEVWPVCAGVDALVGKADQALYKAKASGRNQVVSDTANVLLRAVS